MSAAERKGKNKREDNKNDKFEYPDADYVDYVYSTGGNKNKVELKIFNPEQHIENQLLRSKYLDELEDVYKQFGKKIHKVEEPQMTTCWKYLLRQVEEAGRDFASEREERIKLKRKIAKFAQSTCNRLEQIKEQKVKD